MDNVGEKIQSLLFDALLAESPVLSGNMRDFIGMGMLSPEERLITIDAPFYDAKRWEKDRVVVHTGATVLGRTAYAEWVNRLGGFATHNRSQGWVDRAIRETVEAIAQEIGAEVVYEL